MIRFFGGLVLTAAGVFGAKYLLQLLPSPDGIAARISTLVLATVIVSAAALVINTGAGLADPRRIWAQPEFVQSIQMSNTRAIFVLPGYNGDGEDIFSKLPRLRERGDVYSLKYDSRGFNAARIADRLYHIIVQGGYHQITLVGVSMGGKVILKLLRRHPIIMRDFQGDNLVVAMVATPVDRGCIKHRRKVTLLPLLDGPVTRLLGITSAARADQAQFLAMPWWLGGVKPPAPNEFKEFRGTLRYFKSFMDTDREVDASRAWDLTLAAFPNANPAPTSLSDWHSHVPIDEMPEPLENELLAMMS